MTSTMYSRVFRELANELNQPLTYNCLNCYNCLKKPQRTGKYQKKNANLSAIIKKEKTDLS